MSSRAIRTAAMIDAAMTRVEAIIACKVWHVSSKPGVEGSNQLSYKSLRINGLQTVQGVSIARNPK